MSFQAYDMEGKDIVAIHTHDRILYKRCRRHWDFSSTIRRGLEPSSTAPNANLWLGSGVHFALEDFHGYNRFGDPMVALDAYYNAFSEEQLPMEADSLMESGLKMLEYYLIWRKHRDDYTTLWVDGVPQVEVNFQIVLDQVEDPKGRPVLYRGTFDRVVRDVYGRLWLVDYKTARVIDTDKLETDPQISAYLWAGEMWYGEPIEGILYLQISKEPPVAPRRLTNGTLSLDKRQRTTHGLYRAELLGQYGHQSKFPSQYVEFLNELAGQETPEGNRFIRMDLVRRNEAASASTYQHVLAEAREMLRLDLPIYPNFTRDCARDCSFRTACMCMEDGSDWQYILEAEFGKKGETNEWRKRIKWPT